MIDPKSIVYHFHDFTWEGSSQLPYLLEADEAGSEFQVSQPVHKGISRIEFTQAKQKAAFELRYFEIEPSGYSRMERHEHIHTIIVVRGQGELVLNRTRYQLNHLDVATIDSQEPHQLINPGSGPFGFFCIVDHKRDKPIPLQPEERSGP